MAKSLNSVNLTGYLGNDPRYHQFDDGNEVCNLSLAVGRQKKQDGEWVDDTLWIDVKVSGKQAKACADYLAKGSFIAVSGQLAQPRMWQDSDGSKRFMMVVDYASVSFGPRVDGNAAPAQQQRQQQRPPAAAQAQQRSAGSKFADDDVPW